MTFHSLDGHHMPRELTHWAAWDESYTWCGLRLNDRKGHRLDPRQILGVPVLAAPDAEPTCHTCRLKKQQDDAEYQILSTWNQELLKYGR